MVSYVGQITLFAGKTPPLGWEFCDGHIITGNDVFELATFMNVSPGGAGGNSLALPNMKSPVDNVQYMICTEGAFPREGDPNDTSFDPSAGEDFPEIVEGYIGEIRLFSSGLEQPPERWMRCDGSSISSDKYMALNIVMSGDFGTLNIHLPNLTNPSPYIQYYICAEGQYPTPKQG